MRKRKSRKEKQKSDPAKTNRTVPPADSSERTEGYGILPKRDLKKNLGCG